MSGENITQKHRLRSTNEARKYLIADINQNELMSKEHKFFI